MKKEVNYSVRNKNVAKVRSDEWKKALVRGKFDAMLNPSKLKIQRVKHNISQTQVSNKLGLSLSTYGAIERAKRPVSQKRVQQLSDFFKLKPENLFEKTRKNKFKAL